MGAPVIHPADPVTGSVTVDLGWPVKRKGNGGTLSSVTLRRMNAGDLRAIDALGPDASDERQALLLIQLCSGMLPLDVDALDIVDVTALGGVVGGFSVAGRPTP